MVAGTTEMVNTKPSDELKGYVVEVAKEMDEKPWQAKLYEAMDIVLTGAVDLARSRVHSGAHTYEIDPTYGCTCQDARIRNRYCKHFVAFEMQRRVDARMGGSHMPAKAKATPQDEWEAGVQSGEANAEPALFGQGKPEPDDIPEPEVPEKIRGTARLTPEGRAMAERGEQIEIAIEETDAPGPTPPHYVHTEGHQYVDHPSTLCVKRHLGVTELMWTFRGTNDDEVFARAAAQICKLDDAAQRYAPPVQQTPPPAPIAAPSQPVQVPPPLPPAQPTSGEKSVNHGPQQDKPCMIHSNPLAGVYVYYDLWVKGSRQWLSHKAPDGSFCNAPK